MRQKAKHFIIIKYSHHGSIWNPKEGLVSSPTANKHSLKIKHSNCWPKSACDFSMHPADTRKRMEKQKSNRRVVSVIAVVPVQPPLTIKKVVSSDYKTEIVRKQQKMMLKIRKNICKNNWAPNTQGITSRDLLLHQEALHINVKKNGGDLVPSESVRKNNLNTFMMHFYWSDTSHK